MSSVQPSFAGPLPAAYDSLMGPIFFEPFARAVADRVRGSSGAILETAAGTGRLTRAVADVVAPGATILATDLSASMIAQAVQSLDDPRVTWQEADAQNLPFADASFDLLLCQFGMMFPPDKAAAYAEARRVLRPGGRFAFTVWGELSRSRVNAVVHEAVGEEFPDDPPMFLARIPFGYNDESAIRAALASAGFGPVDIERLVLTTQAASARDLAMALCTGSPLRMEIETRAPGRLEAVIEAVARRVRKRLGDGPVSSPTEALLFTATRSAQRASVHAEASRPSSRNHEAVSGTDDHHPHRSRLSAPLRPG